MTIIPPRTIATTPPYVTDIVQVLRTIEKWRVEGHYKSAIRVKIFRNYSAEFIEPFLKYYFGEIGIACQLSLSGYDTIQQDILGGEDLSTYDLIVVSLWLEGLASNWNSGEPVANEVWDRLTDIVSLVIERSKSPVLVNSFLRPIIGGDGAAQSMRESSPDLLIFQVNSRLRDYVGRHASRCLLIDWERLVMLIGVDAALDPRMGYLAAAPFRHAFLSAYAYEIFRVGRALKGAVKKCVILDCDNTLWGGIVGEVGVEGIELGPNEYPGKAFYDFQKSIVRLVKQGVMVALCSKNNLEDAMAVLDTHPHCLLKRDHLAAYRIDWNDKENNISEIVEELNIGMDAVVFVDDSDVECARVQSFIPDLTVRQVPKQLYDLPPLLEREGLFDKLSVTAEDLERTKMYQADSRRRESKTAYKSVDAFLTSLQIKAHIAPVTAARAGRVSQLTQKTNQFNVTTRRYSEGDIARMADDPDHAVYTLSVEDRFGDLGLTGVLIARRQGDEAHVDTMLMSCRVLGRRLENEFVSHCVGALNARWRPRSWHAEYIPTTKNAQVSDFWSMFGFVAKDAGQRDRRYTASPVELKLEHADFITVEDT